MENKDFNSVGLIKMESEDIARAKNREIYVFGANTSQWSWVLMNTAATSLTIAFSAIFLYVFGLILGGPDIVLLGQFLINMLFPVSLFFLLFFLKAVKKIEFKNGKKSAFLILSKASLFKALFMEPKSNEDFEPTPVQEFTKIG